MSMQKRKIFVFSQAMELGGVERRLLTALCAPAGWALTGYIRRKAGK